MYATALVSHIPQPGSSGSSLVLFCIIAGLIFGHPSVIGYNEMIQCGSHGKAHMIRIGRLDYRVQAELFKSTASAQTGDEMLECREHR